MNKHTPGPWEVAYQDKNGQSVIKAEHFEVATCWHHCVGSIENEMHFNARLIAAAPDLLTALLAIAKEAGDQFGHDESPETINRMAFYARKAIAKATEGKP